MLDGQCRAWRVERIKNRTRSNGLTPIEVRLTLSDSNRTILGHIKMRPVTKCSQIKAGKHGMKKIRQ